MSGAASLVDCCGASGKPVGKVFVETDSGQSMSTLAGAELSFRLRDGGIPSNLPVRFLKPVSSGSNNLAAFVNHRLRQARHERKVIVADLPGEAGRLYVEGMGSDNRSVVCRLAEAVPAPRPPCTCAPHGLCSINSGCVRGYCPVRAGPRATGTKGCRGGCPVQKHAGEQLARAADTAGGAVWR